jgi:UDP-N-acetyl-D-glucosamine dehydrogenase
MHRHTEASQQHHSSTIEGEGTVADGQPELLVQKIQAREARIGIVGLGYVGLPLAVAFAQAGFDVIGVDVNEKKVASIAGGVSYVADVSSDDLAALTGRGTLSATTDFSVLARCDAVSICVPTPLSKLGDPDMSYIVSAVEALVPHLHRGMVIVLESTTYPGTTREIVLPLLSDNAAQLQVGEDFFLAFSPERVDPGRIDWTTRTTPRVVGGTTPVCREMAVALYGQVIDTIVPVSSTDAAEMAKLLENTFRAINIGLANEVLLMCDKLGLDAWEVIDAAATKPFGFMKFVPGPGIGGHCIPIDPLYLSWRLKRSRYHARFIDLAAQVNTGMPGYWVQKVQDALNEVGKAMNGATVLVLGIAYKRDIDDIRESPAHEIIKHLVEKGATVHYHDPFVDSFHEDGLDMQSVTDDDLTRMLREVDCVLLVTDHSVYDRGAIRTHSKLFIDTRLGQHKFSPRALKR